MLQVDNQQLLVECAGSEEEEEGYGVMVFRRLRVHGLQEGRGFMVCKVTTNHYFLHVREEEGGYGFRVPMSSYVLRAR